MSLHSLKKRTWGKASKLRNSEEVKSQDLKNEREREGGKEGKEEEQAQDSPVTELASLARSHRMVS